MAWMLLWPLCAQVRCRHPGRVVPGDGQVGRGEGVGDHERKVANFRVVKSPYLIICLVLLTTKIIDKQNFIFAL